MNDDRRFEAHPGRGRFNAAFFAVMDGYINWHLKQQKIQAYKDLPETVVELGPGRSQPALPTAWHRAHRDRAQPVMQAPLRRAAAKRGIDLELRDVTGEKIDLPGASVDAMISSLVLCAVGDPAQVVTEVRRILRPGGKFCFVEHVAAADGTPTRRVQHLVRQPWAWVFEGCSCERDLASVIKGAGFAKTEIRPYRIHSPFLPFNTQIAGSAMA